MLAPASSGHLRVMAALLAAAIAAGSLVVVSAPPADAGTFRYRFFQFNMCGNNALDCHRDGVVEAIRNSIFDFHPHAVSLNEACRSQFRRLHDLLDGSEWDMRGRFSVARTGVEGCGGNHEYGIAVLTRNPITGVFRRALPSPDSESRQLLCVTVRMAERATRVCSTHITTGDHPWFQNREIRTVKRTVTPWVENGTPVVLMGDFNVTPTSDKLDRMYAPGHGGDAFGRFQEVDEGPDYCRCGEWTHGSRKIDYVFLSAPNWRSLWGDATFSDYSDHDPLRGKAARQG
jgi:endonuclease/exonuclease/phosphatase family metal-dependent hydrolase